MYKCNMHGELDSEWCDECEKVVDCNCVDTVATRFKDQIYDCDKGERTVTLWFYSCETCGKTSHVEIEGR